MSPSLTLTAPEAGWQLACRAGRAVVSPACWLPQAREQRPDTE